MTIQVVDESVVQQYLVTCDLDILKSYFRVLGESRGYRDSGPYVCEECKNIAPNSPIITWLSQSEDQEKTWGNLMTLAKGVASDRGLDFSLYFPHFYSTE